ncbi:MAG: hypothetical protein JOZ69_02155, partial [Myxococcales bacterium]|nr:hypothetical protein [Myxococcales bacterium]
MANGYVVYPGAYQGNDVLHRPSPSGTEESIAFAAKPAAEHVTYDVSLGRGVAGLRLVANTVEFLDHKGTPRLHMAPPFVAGAGGSGAWASVSVQGCAVDQNPAGPWGRPVVPPGQRHCAVDVDWSGGNVPYPAVLDPVWSSGQTMSTPRWKHGGAVIQAGGRELGLVFGGYSSFNTTIGSAELFDEVSKTWSPTDSMPTDVAYASSLALTQGPLAGTVLVLGGFQARPSGGVEYAGVQAYNPATGHWTVQGNLGSSPREGCAAVELPGGKVLVVGGFGPFPTVYANAVLYDPGSGTSSPAGSMQSARGDLAATVLPLDGLAFQGDVFVVGGVDASGVPQNVADAFDPSTNSWTAVPAPGTARFAPLATAIDGGRVLLTGGDDPSLGIGGTLGTREFDRARRTWLDGPATFGSHYQGTLVSIPNGTSRAVVLAGGDQSLNWAEFWQPDAPSWLVLSPLVTGRDGHVALTLQSGLLLAGGSDGNGTLLPNTELYNVSIGKQAPQWPAQATLGVDAVGAGSATLQWPNATDPNGVS